MEKPAHKIPPARPGKSLVVQMMEASVGTLAGVKKEHAEKIYKNFYKGDPPFKPQKGNFGKVSWFKGQGNPYVGGQVQNYALEVDVDIPRPRRLREDYFANFQKQYLEKHPEVDLNKTDWHRDFWTALGKSLEDEGLAEVFVPQGDLSWHDSGTFIVANAAARMRVNLANPAKFRNELAAAGVNVNAIEQEVDAKELTHAKSFNIKLNSIKAQVKKQKSANQLLTELLQSQGGFGIVPAQFQNIQEGVIPVPQNASLVERLRGPRHWISADLHYPTYKQARQQAKLWAFAASTPDLVNNYGDVTITKGAGWSNKAIRGYREVY